MYESFYGLTARPFDLTSNPRALFLTEKYREALSYVQYGIESRSAITLLVGEAGIGKTTVLRAAVESFDPAHSAIVTLTNPALKRAEFLQFLAQAFSLSPAAAASKTELIFELHRRLLDLFHQNKPVALVVDEAQSLPTGLLGEIRLLVNLETSTHKLLPIVLVGQPELAEVLNRPSFVPLKQRVAFRCVLDRLELNETASYVLQRIRSVGGHSNQLFTFEAVVAIHEWSRGIPRTINVICDNALIAGFAAGERPVREKLIDEVCDHLDLERLGSLRQASDEGLVGEGAQPPRSDSGQERSVHRDSIMPTGTTTPTRKEDGARAGLFQRLSGGRRPNGPNFTKLDLGDY